MISRLWLLVALVPVVMPGAVGWKDILRQPADWYATPEAGAIAASVLQYQTGSGGWPKNRDMTLPPDADFLAETKQDRRAPTIDNDATTTQIRFLAKVGEVQDNVPAREAALRGIDYLMAAQYENGGWPQYYPLAKGYYTHITYNDDAMAKVLELLRQVATGVEPYSFVDAPRRARATVAVGRGIDCILRTQVRQNGKLTAWCAQHDEITLAPAWARNFEPPSLSGSESVGLVRFLMGQENPSPEVIASIEGAVAWLRSVEISGLRLESFTDGDGKRDRRAVADAQAESLWARFYELETNRPIYTGRDRVIRYDFNEIEYERRNGYSYLNRSPVVLLEKDYPRWREKHRLP